MLERFNDLSLVGLLILAWSCEVPYDLPVKKTELEYVVDGLITDNPGPYSVTLTYSADYSSSNDGTNLPVEGANVMITDNEGLPAMLSPAPLGLYWTAPGFKGEATHTYILHILTANGDELMSDPELMPPSSPIVGDRYEFEPEDAFHEDGHRVWIKIADNPGQKNYYRWTINGVYQFATVLSSSIPTSTQCWQYEYYPFKIMLASDQFVEGNTFEQEIMFIPYFSGSPYLVTVYQQSLTKEAYDFWKLVNDQINHSSGIFAVQPARIRGNMYCVNNSAKKVLGYFGASSMIKHPVFVRRTNGKVKNLRSYEKVPCYVYPNTVPYVGDTSTWPEGWPLF
jgi:hypothetical protein